MPTVPLPKPTPARVVSYIQRFDKEEGGIERTLTKLFRRCPKNTTLEDVLLKVVILNALYHTSIFSAHEVAKHILRLKIDAWLQAGQSEAVDLIARVQLGKKERYNYSFATKYCSWHNREAYPIYDKHVDAILWGYRKQDQFAEFQRQDLWEYDEFKHVIMTFRTHYKLEAFDFKDLDKFLWLASQDYYQS
jgi:hypothetical protein